MKLLTVIGARPQIIKASAFSRAIKECYSDTIEEVIVHTGQHYDENMSEVFFTELDIPAPKYNLAVGSGKHGVQTAKMIERLEEVIEAEQPNALILYGDTNSTLAGAIAASKVHLPIVHIEAGLRSFDKAMPEEVNRILCDHVSTLLFSPTRTGYENLVNEGFSTQLQEKPTANKPNIYHCGDIMYDNTLFFSSKADSVAEKFDIPQEGFVLCTIHRNSNTDDKERLKSIFDSIIEISNFKKIILPLHPRTKKMMPLMLGETYAKAVEENPNIQIIEPVSFLGMIYGVQKEAYYLNKPAVILRPQTEWKEIVDCGNAAICDADFDLIVSKAKEYLANPPIDFPKIFGDGNAAKFMCKTILECL